MEKGSWVRILLEKKREIKRKNLRGRLPMSCMEKRHGLFSRGNEEVFKRVK